MKKKDWDGCYKDLFSQVEYEDEERERLVIGEDLPDGVFAVERLACNGQKAEAPTNLTARDWQRDVCLGHSALLPAVNY